MKRLLSAILCLCMLLVLTACGSGSTANTTPTGGTQGTTAAAGAKGFRVGYARQDITPSQIVDLWGYAQRAGQRMSKDGVLDYIYLTCVAVTDESDNTVLFYAADLGSMEASVTADIKTMVNKKLDIPMENIFLNATHTHSAPACYDIKTVLVDAAVKIGKEALEDQKPAQMYFGTANTSGINFVRHYWGLDGKSITDNHGDTSATEFKGHTTEIDQEMRVLQFKREGGKDVILVNWQSHPHMTGGPQKYSISADIVGMMRMNMEQDLDCLFAYYQGGAGNINPTSRIKSEMANPDMNYKVTGKMLAETAAKALENMTQLEAGPITVKSETFTCQSNQEDLDKLDAAQKVVDYYLAGHTATEAKPYAEDLGLASYYHENNLLGRAKREPDFEIEISVVAIGDLAWAIMPGEFFDTTTRYIRENSPYTYNFTAAYTNGYHGYFPSQEAWDYGCYEADVAPGNPGETEAIADRLLEMLKEIHG